jgi:GNAT superfamily N-acetyltransferase
MIKLKELFDTKPINVRVSKYDDSGTSPEEVVYFKMLNKKGYMIDYKVTFYEDKPDSITFNPEDKFYNVEFLSKLQDEAPENYSMEILGGMQPFKIFASVWKIIDSSLKKLGAVGFMMAADKDETSRVSLYEKFAKLIDEHSDWKLYTTRGSSYKNFVFFRKDEIDKHEIKSGSTQLHELASSHNLAKELENELNRKYPSKDKNGFVIELWSVSYRNDFIELVALRIPKEYRNQGIGTSIMNWIIQYADKNHKIIGATPSKDFGASSVNRIKRFNKRFGFVQNTGRTADYTISNTMYRKPKTA